MDAAPRKPRHKKQPGEGTGPRRIDGLALDVRTGAAFLGATQKAVYGQVERRTIPFRRLGGRIVFLRSELEAWLETLPGVTLDEARMNQEARQR